MPGPQHAYSTASMMSAAGSLSSKIRIHVACRDLIKLDLLSHSDPFAVLSFKAGGGWREVGRTEVLGNQKHPSFSTTFSIEYHFEELQPLRVAVYDFDGPTSAYSSVKRTNLDRHDFIGAVETTLGKVVGSSHGVFAAALEHPKAKSKPRGVLQLVADELETDEGELTLEFRASKVDKKDWFGKSDPYLEFGTFSRDGTFRVMHRTEVIKTTLNPHWRRFTAMLSKFSLGDTRRRLGIRCYDWDRDGSHDFIGQTESTVEEFLSGAKSEWPLLNPKKMPGGKKAKKGYKNSGVLLLLHASFAPRSTFLQYLHGGLELNVSMAIDFTQSNGDVRNPASLHYCNPYQPNAYATAIQAVGTILQDYDADQIFPAYGYGGKLPNGVVSHDFNLNGSDNPDCHGVVGVLGAYTQALSSVALWGPTNFSPVINRMIDVAAAAQREARGKSYHILLIITDGVITDMGRTVDAIVQASPLPLSIVIVGVGTANFDNMEELDSDDTKLRDSRGNTATRDIVQFVAFRDFHNDGAALAKEVLAEIPTQVEEWAVGQGITAAPPAAAPPEPAAAAGGYGVAAPPTKSSRSGRPSSGRMFKQQSNAGAPPPSYDELAAAPSDFTSC